MKDKAGFSTNRITAFIGTAVLFVLAFFCVAEFLSYMSVNHGNYQTYEIMDHWDVDYCGTHYDDISRLDRRPQAITSHKNDTLTMTRRIRELSPYRITLRLYSRLSEVRVSIVDKNGNDRLIYYYGYDSQTMNTGEFTGSGYHFVQLPEDCYGKTLKIMEQATEDGALKGLPDMEITPSSHSMEVFAQSRTFGVFVTTFMFIAGSVLTIVSMFTALLDREFFQLTFLGLFSAFGALWCMCSSKVIEMFSLNIQLNGYIEYMSLYIMVIPLLALSFGFFKNIPAVSRVVLFVTMCLDIALATGACVLQIRKMANVNFLLPAFHVILAFTAVFLSGISILHWHRSTMPERFFEGGILTAAASGIVYMLVFYTAPRGALDSGALDIFLVPAAFLVLVILILLGYITDLYARRVDEKQRARLTVLAFEDELTGLANRTRGDQEMQRLDEEGGRFVFVDFDLNFLKKANDKYGHTAGDLYIRTFSRILAKCFHDADYICRMGGDEFLVIYSENIPTNPELRDRLDTLEEMEKVVTGSFPVPVSVDASYGYAYSTEVKGGQSEAVYQLADQRMYRMKMDSKKGRTD